MMANINLLVIEKHAVDSLDRIIGRLSSFIMDKTIAFGATLLVGGNFAREDVAKGSKSVMQCLVVNKLVQILNEDVALTSFAKAGSRWDHMIRHARFLINE